MVQGNFNWSPETGKDLIGANEEEGEGAKAVMERVELLKKKLGEVIEAARALRKEKSRLEDKVIALETELAQKTERLLMLEESCAAVEQVTSERDRLLEERGEVRLQIEELLGELEGIELG